MAGYLGYDVLGTLTLGDGNMTPTTLRAAAATIAETIRAMTPNYELFQDFGWHPVARVRDVPGGALRLFNIEWSIPVPRTDGIYGDDAVECSVVLKIFTNYGALPEDDDQFQDVHAEIISSDGNQIWLALDDSVDPVIGGLCSVTRAEDPFAFEDVEPGQVWGAHMFDVTILLSH